MWGRGEFGVGRSVWLYCWRSGCRTETAAHVRGQLRTSESKSSAEAEAWADPPTDSQTVSQTDRWTPQTGGLWHGKLRLQGGPEDTK